MLCCVLSLTVPTYMFSLRLGLLSQFFSSLSSITSHMNSFKLDNVPGCRTFLLYQGPTKCCYILQRLLPEFIGHFLGI